MSAHDEQQAKDWQEIRYGNKPEARAALDYYRDRGWPVDDQNAKGRHDDLLLGFRTGYREALALRRASPETGWQEAADALRLAREVTNTWACVARTKRDHDAIARFHQVIDNAKARLFPPGSAPSGG